MSSHRLHRSSAIRQSRRLSCRIPCHGRQRPLRRSYAGDKRLIPISSIVVPIALTARAITRALMAPMQPTRKVSIVVSLPGW
jgi:hypothetical protein